MTPAFKSLIEEKYSVVSRFEGRAMDISNTINYELKQVMMSLITKDNVNKCYAIMSSKFLHKIFKKKRQ